MMTVSSVACTVLLALLGAGLPVDPEPEIWFSTSVYPYGPPSSRPRRDTGYQEDTLDAAHVPSSVCRNMTPSHDDSEPQTSCAPYVVFVDKKKVRVGGIVNVTLWSEGDAIFRGIYIQARPVGSETPIGTFQPQNDSSVVVSDCPPSTNNALSYISSRGRKWMKLKWQAPYETGIMKFRCTFVQTFDKFWVGVESREIRIVP